MRDARWVTEARRGECGHISNSASHSVTLLSNQGCRILPQDGVTTLSNVDSLSPVSRVIHILCLIRF